MHVFIDSDTIITKAILKLDIVFKNFMNCTSLKIVLL